MNMRLKKLRVLAAAMAFVCVPMQGYTVEEPHGRNAVNVTSVAKKAIPAVVSVQVKALDSHSSLSGQEQDPYDFFNDEFFRQFFGRRSPSRPQPRLQSGQASGFIISQDGYILTNGHVVNHASEILIALNDGREFKADVIGIDTNTDIAVIKIEATNLPFLNLGNSDDLEVGQWVVAVGNPLGLQASVTAGVVSAKGRSGLDLARIEDFIQTDAAINRGNSGGPLLNLNGDVIGMNTAIVTNLGSGGYMGIGFAIPSTMIQLIMDQLINNGSVTRGFIGVSLQQVNNDLAQSFGLDRAEGALISDISKGSPAEKAGLKQGDVIMEFDGKKITGIGALKNAVSLMVPGSKMQLSILRNGKRTTVPLTIAAYPDEEKAPAIKENKLGLEVEALTTEIARTHRFDNLQGVVVKKVDPQSTAAWAGIKPGTLIIAVNHQEVKTPEDFMKRLQEADPKKPLLFLIKQGDYMQFVSIKVG